MQITTFPMLRQIEENCRHICQRAPLERASPAVIGSQVYGVRILASFAGAAPLDCAPRNGLRPNFATASGDLYEALLSL
ncbi:hypothetical protein MGG_17892 [Pyricularia oryzae 70-15]|uniref:Uncharacterized protein n=3 Tax=Pyricularia oryzae TaxID=318829 RepID=G5EH82_PYRO7|nr:uncharacterized protein MGG_17892 [Pyricularia oryzae 70-15]EAQ71385.1 hypothetical protein MGCH7_ch7g792 [Pyricularia oryzae 70-15]EHA45940.1 hypothetical protein MGG_17892 [Pyricularia oryzae 70-15]ELQ41528.1 hypothetical protein OOU_Y34scaffold00275g44 [Pyricularia oryzae Y34]